jgi:hypothetical protein
MASINTGAISDATLPADALGVHLIRAIAGT